MAEVTIWNVEMQHSGRIKRFEMVTAKPSIWTSTKEGDKVVLQLLEPGHAGMPSRAVSIELSEAEEKMLARALRECGKLRKELKPE